MTLKRCPECDAVLWEFSPRLRDVHSYIKSRKEVTSVQLAKRFGISISNASNAVRTLEDNGLVIVRTVCHPTGGRMKVVSWR